MESFGMSSMATSIGVSVAFSISSSASSQRSQSPSLGDSSRVDSIKVPPWTDIVKTGKLKELAPYDPDWYIQAGTLMNNYAHILNLLTRLRQAVDHPYLVVHSNSRGANANLNDEKKTEHECVLCHDPADDYVIDTEPVDQITFSPVTTKSE